jgi:hypothetical protein
MRALFVFPRTSGWAAIISRACIRDLLYRGRDIRLKEHPLAFGSRFEVLDGAALLGEAALVCGYDTETGVETKERSTHSTVAHHRLFSPMQTLSGGKLAQTAKKQV